MACACLSEREPLRLCRSRSVPSGYAFRDLVLFHFSWSLLRPAASLWCVMVWLLSVYRVLACLPHLSLTPIAGATVFTSGFCTDAGARSASIGTKLEFRSAVL